MARGESMEHPYIVVLVTATSAEEAEAIAHMLVESRLAACVNVFPIRSTYRWQGQVHHDEEWQLTIKTERSQFESLAQAIGEHHSYEVPEIIALPIVAGSQPYLNWMGEQVGQPNKS